MATTYLLAKSFRLVKVLSRVFVVSESKSGANVSITLSIRFVNVPTQSCVCQGRHLNH